MVSPTQLFDHLVRLRELITYKHAYELLLRPLTSEWRNQVHGAEIANKISGTLPRKVRDLTITLDALVVAEANHEPSSGHFNRHDEYSRSDWRSKFRDWSLCQHSESDIRTLATRAGQSR